MLGPHPDEQGDQVSRAVIEREATVERWTADPSRTTFEFEVEHLWGLHTVRGDFSSFNGAYVVGPSGSTIELTIDAGSVDTGCPARDKHLRSAEFFSADEHPLVRFTSTRITGLGSGRVHVTGELEAAGRRVPLAFDTSVRLMDGELELEATTTVDQSRFGMTDGPLSNVRRPTMLRVKTRLVRGADDRG
jgi:polyisoprenoid-binding protein YceI